MAPVAIRVFDDAKLDETSNDLSELREAARVDAVTGQYKIIAAILL